MNADQIALIPDRLLVDPRTSRLEEWLHARGQHMTLLELDAERRRRGLRIPRPNTH